MVDTVESPAKPGRSLSVLRSTWGFKLRNQPLSISLISQENPARESQNPANLEDRVEPERQFYPVLEADIRREWQDVSEDRHCYARHDEKTTEVPPFLRAHHPTRLRIALNGLRASLGSPFETAQFCMH